MVARRLVLASFAMSLGACSGPGRGPAGEGTGGDGDGEDSESGEHERLDLGIPGDPGPCTKIDLLFVIDDSGSMAAEQQALLAAFPAFVAGIEQNLGGLESYHVGVVTTEPYPDNAVGCRDLGDLVTRTGGEGSSESDCTPFSSGGRYLDESEPDLAAKFGCIAQVGIGGAPGEMQVGALLSGLVPPKTAHGCNAGFSRMDALLVVVLITDEDDAEACFAQGCVGGTPGSPDDWYEQLVAHKGGREENVILVTIAGAPGAYWECGVEEAPRLAEFTGRFTHGLMGDICDEDVAQTFVEALALVESGCAHFSPVG
jgi:hypothetical protein